MTRMRMLCTALVVGAMAAACGGSPPPAANPQPPVDPAPPAPPPEAPPPAPPAPHAEVGEYGFDKSGMDTSSDPTSFFKYANGNFEKLHPIPDDKTDWGSFIVLSDKSEERTKDILEHAKSATPDEQKIGDFYRTFMDDKAIEAKGAEPIKPVLAEIDGLKTLPDVIAEIAKLDRVGVNTPIGTGVGVDQKDPEHYIASFGQSGLLLPDRDYYDVKKTQFAPAREAYKKYIVDAFKLAGLAGDVDKRAAAVYAFEESLAKVHWTRVQLRDPVANYNKIAMADLPKIAPGYDWKVFLDGVGFANEKFLDIGPKAAIIAEARVVKGTPVAVLKDYLALHVIQASSPFLSKAFVDLNFDMFAKTLSGVPQQRPRWKRAVQATERALGEALGKSYVAKYFPPETKAAADKLVANLLASMGKHIESLPWMTDATKQKAKIKLATYNPKIGYPKKWRDYSKLEVKAGDLFGNVLRANEFETQRALAKLGQPVDRDEWAMLPMTVNAYYNPTQNEIVFPAAILQPPFFDAHADDAVNYGGIGAVIGHEISHGFDDEGRQYDEKGALKDWWTKEDAAKFKVYADKLVAQYNAYCPFPGQGNKPALCINGRLTLGENIADLAGLTIAYDAYKTALGGKEAPVIDGTTGDQRFFLGFAQVWRLSTRPEEQKNRMSSDPHSPAEFRTSVVRNLDAWYEAFKLQPGKGIALPPDQRVKIW